MDPLTHLATGVSVSQLLPGAVPVVGRAWPGPSSRCCRTWIIFSSIGTAWPLSAITGALPTPWWPCSSSPWRGPLLGRVLGGPRWFTPLLILGSGGVGQPPAPGPGHLLRHPVLIPFSRRRFTLDWIFIIDPYFTALLLAGAVAALASPPGAAPAGACFLAAAGVYLLVCAFYHHQALNLARQVFPRRHPGGHPSAHTLTCPARPRRARA